MRIVGRNHTLATRGACFLFILFAACSTVPKEAVELSYLVGQDLGALHDSYDLLIQQRFDDFRAQRLDYLENRWRPAFLKEFIRNGKLVEAAKGEVVLAGAKFESVPAAERGSPQRLNQQLHTIERWAEVATKKIEEKKQALMQPLDEDEEKLRKDVREAFQRIQQANAYVTAHLNSLRKVQDVQDEALRALGIKELRDKINKGLIDASNLAADGLEKVKKADGIVDKVIDVKDDISSSG